MIIKLNNDGTLSTYKDRVFKMSNGVNTVTLFSSISKYSTILINFKLPNGTVINGNMIYSGFSLDENNNFWQYDIKQPITTIAGRIEIGLEVKETNTSKVLMTATTYMTIEDSLPSDLDAPTDINLFLDTANEALAKANDAYDYADQAKTYADNKSDEAQNLWESYIQAGDTNLEVVEARNDFTTLNQRLDYLKNNDNAINVINFGALGDGIVDDTNAIQNAINYASTQKTKNIIIPSGTYKINPNGVDALNRGLIIPSNVNIYMENDTILKALPNDTGTSSIISVVQSENVKIIGGQIIGERSEHIGTTGEHGMGITILNSSNVTIDNILISDCWGDCVYVGGNNFGIADTTKPSKIHIKNCFLNNSRRQGISVTLCDGVIIENCKITNVNGVLPEFGIDIETNYADLPCLNVIVKSCYFNGSAKGGLVVGNNAFNILINNCIFDNNSLELNKSTNTIVNGCNFINTKVFISSSKGVNVSSNVFDNSYVSLYTNATITRLTNINNNIFKNNDESTTRKAVELTGVDGGSYDLVVTGNYFYNYISETIYMYNYSYNTVISNNVITTNNISRWVMYLKAYDAKVTGNLINISATNPINVNNVINLVGVRGSLDNNTITLINLTVAESIIACLDNANESKGMTFINNSIDTNQNIQAIKFTSTGTMQYKVIYNNFRYTNNAILNPGTHFIYGNILSTTV